MKEGKVKHYVVANMMKHSRRKGDKGGEEEEEEEEDDDEEEEEDKDDKALDNTYIYLISYLTHKDSVQHITFTLR